MRIWISLILVVVGVVVARAQYPDADLSKEPRLQQPLTLKYPVISLHELCRRLSEQLSVRLQVEKPLQPLSATLRIEKRPAAEVLTKLAAVFRAEWKQVEEEGQVRYLLVRQPAVKAEEQQIDALLKLDTLQILHDALRRLPPRLLQMTPKAIRDEYAQSYSQSDSPLAWLHNFPNDPKKALSREGVLQHALQRLMLQMMDSSGWLFVHVMHQLSDEQWRAIARGATLIIAADQLPSNLLSQYEQAWMSETVQHRKIFGEEEDPHEETPQMDVTSYKLKQIRIRYDPHRRQLAADVIATMFRHHNMAPDEPSEAESYSRVELSCLSEMDIRNLIISVGHHLDSTDTLMSLREKPIAPGRTFDDEMRARLRNDWINYAAYILVDAAEQLKLHLIGEWTPMHRFDGFSFAFENMDNWSELWLHLNMDYHFQHDSDWLTFCPRATVITRRVAIPVELLRQWLSPKSIDLDWLSQIVSRCSPQQIDCIIALKRYGMAALGIQSENLFLMHREGAPLVALSSAQRAVVRNWLLFYATLTPLQRKSLSQGGSLHWRDLTMSQRRALVAALQTVPDATFEEEMYFILYRMAQEQPLNEADSQPQESTLPHELTTSRIQIRTFETKQSTSFHFYEGEPYTIPARRSQYVEFILTTDGGKERLRVPVLLRWMK
jgi:hypothetical protein